MNFVCGDRIGIWLNADPIGLAGGLNLYAYVGNSPNDFVDPLGLVSLSFFPPNSLNENAASGVNMIGIFTVGGHGLIPPTGGGGAEAIASSVIPRDPFHGVPEEINVDQLADRIMKDPTYRPGMPVFLDVCSAGKRMNNGDASIAQQLSIRLSDLSRKPTSVVGPSTSSFATQGAFDENPDGTANSYAPGVWSVYRAGSPTGLTLSNQNYKDLIPR